ncbi:hypothetical protein HOY80DRAFT_1066516 [Tuber brumale]|nr:hypothetical protein HOY80DRAFT_1066516 [Tuber brumale]
MPSPHKWHRLISSTHNHYARSGTGSQIDIITGHRSTGVRSGPVKELVVDMVENSLEQLKQDISLLEESTYRLKASHITEKQVESLMIVQDTLEDLVEEIELLKKSPDKQGKLLDILKENLLRHIDEKRVILKEHHRELRMTYNNRVKELDKLEVQLKKCLDNENKVLNKIHDMGEKKLRRSGQEDKEFVIELCESTDVLIEDMKTFKDEVELDLKKQGWDLLAIEHQLEIQYNKWISNKYKVKDTI